MIVKLSGLHRSCRPEMLNATIEGLSLTLLCFVVQITALIGCDFVEMRASTHGVGNASVWMRVWPMPIVRRPVSVGWRVVFVWVRGFVMRIPKHCGQTSAGWNGRRGHFIISVKAALFASGFRRIVVVARQNPTV